jgi:hypothetical protein
MSEVEPRVLLEQTVALPSSANFTYSWEKLQLQKVTKNMHSVCSPHPKGLNILSCKVAIVISFLLPFYYRVKYNFWDLVMDEEHA